MGFIEWFNTTKARYIAQRTHTKGLKILKYVLNRVLHGSTNLLSSYNTSIISKVFTAFLQFISFITTYAGFSFYLNSLNTLAPFLLAVVVQGTAYFCMNYSATKKRTGVYKRRVLLFVMISLSMVTSYIGVVNLVIKPTDNIRSEYEKYMSTHNELMKPLVATPNIDKAYGKINEVRKAAKSLYNSIYMYDQPERDKGFTSGTYGQMESTLKFLLDTVETAPEKVAVMNSLNKIIENDLSEKEKYMEFNGYLKDIIALDNYASSLKVEYGVDGTATQAKNAMFDTYDKILISGFYEEYDFERISSIGKNKELELPDFITASDGDLTKIDDGSVQNFDLLSYLLEIPEIVGVKLTPPDEIVNSAILRENVRKIINNR